LCKYIEPVDNSDIYFHHINPDNFCRVTFSFGFYNRDIAANPDPYLLVPMPSANLYLGPFHIWTFGINLRVKCQQRAALCEQNINLAQSIHTVWNTSPIWQTLPHYVGGPNNQGVDFISEPDANVLYIVTGKVNPHYAGIRTWLLGNPLQAAAGIEIIEVEELPDGGFDLIQWILDRINDINNLAPLTAYRADNGLGPIPLLP